MILIVNIVIMIILSHSPIFPGVLISLAFSSGRVLFVSDSYCRILSDLSSPVATNTKLSNKSTHLTATTTTAAASANFPEDEMTFYILLFFVVGVAVLSGFPTGRSVDDDTTQSNKWLLSFCNPKVWDCGFDEHEMMTMMMMSFILVDYFLHHQQHPFCNHIHININPFQDCIE